MRGRMRFVVAMAAVIVAVMLVLPAASFADDAISLTKTASASHLDGPGEVTYTFSARNNTDVRPWSQDQDPAQIVGVTLIDSKLGQIESAPTGDNGNERMDPGETWVWTETATISEDTPNSATITGTLMETEQGVSATSGVVTVTVGEGAAPPPATDPGTDVEVAGEIPETATPWYSLLFVGGVLVLAGVIGFTVTTRRRHA